MASMEERKWSYIVCTITSDTLICSAGKNVKDSKVRQNVT